MYRKIEDSVIEDIIELLKQGVEMKKIAKTLHVGINTVVRYRNLHGIEKPTIKQEEDKLLEDWDNMCQIAKDVKREKAVIKRVNGKRVAVYI